MKPSQSIYLMLLAITLVCCNDKTTEIDKSPKPKEDDVEVQLFHNPPADGHIHPGTMLEVNGVLDPRPLFGKLAIIKQHSEDVITEVLPFINTNRIKITPDDILKPGNHGHFQYDTIVLEALDNDGNAIANMKVKIAVNLERIIIKDTTGHVH